ncbi:hypothetical protein MYXO_03527 [Myxococcaceae bacterium]|jgi:hypothetical protein|nr:hypothetical protein MYXO_03527 [Myxococcaceae bacterium]
MPKLMLPRLLCCTVAAGLVLALAGSADAKVVYRWKTDDGVVAFTDDPKRIPEKYRADARASTLRPLRSYRNFTPAQRSGTRAHLEQMRESARALGKLNERLSGRVRSGVVAPGTAAGEEAVLRVGSAGQTQVEIQSPEFSDAPFVIEQKRFYVPGLDVTRRDTIVRQGDKIIAITKPLPNQDDISTIPSESVLPD